MAKINLDNILNIQENILSILDEDDWLVESDAEEVTEDLADLYSSLEKDKNWILSKLFWDKNILKFKWYKSKRDMLYIRYDNIKEQLNNNITLYEWYYNEMLKEINNIKTYIETATEEEDIDYINNYLKTDIVWLENTLNRVDARITAFKWVLKYMINNTTSFKVAFNNALIETNWQKFLEKTVAFNSALVKTITDVNKKQTANAVKNLALASEVKDRSILSIAELMDESNLLTTAKKEHLKLTTTDVK